MISGMRRQRGTTLIIALIMLVLLTLFAVSSFNTANTNLKVVGNMQQRAEALNAGQQGVETVLSTPLFISNPANAVLTPCGAANMLCIDVTGDGVADFTTRIAGPDYPTPPHQPGCISVRTIKNQELNLANSEDLGCAAGQQSTTAGVAGAMTGDSLCANTVWEIRGVTTSASSSSTATVVQGVGVRVSTDAAGTSC